MKFLSNCRYFIGDRPCTHHKREGIRCDECPYYEPLKERILIIKLGAAGDVIRATPLIRKIKKEMPNSYITWVTYFPDLIPSVVDEPLRLNDAIAPWITSQEFDVIYNLDKDKEAIGLAEQVKSSRKFGFGMDAYGRCRPFNNLAEYKFLTGIFDDLSKANNKSYPEELFEICGYEFCGEKYILDKKITKHWEIEQPRPLIGLNTGCGSRWKSRLWPGEYWIELALELKKRGLGVLFLGGSQEDQNNARLGNLSGGAYLGHFPLDVFIALVDECDLVVTQVTMALHIAIAFGKRIVLMNNIFNPNEFELYELGEIVYPSKPCGCYFTPNCPHDSMRSISASAVLDAVNRQLTILQATCA